MRQILKNIGNILFLAMIAQASNIYAANSDSSSITPPNLTAVPVTPKVTTGQPTTAITGGDYSTLVSCPGDPSASSPPYSAPICPDINGKYSGAVPSQPNLSCPDTCKVTNYVAPNYLSAKEAYCPTGYAQIGAFNMREEVSSNAGMTHVATSQADMNDYSSKGWTCSPTTYTNGTWCVACNSTGGDTVPGGADGGWYSSIPADPQGRAGIVRATNNRLTINGQKNFNKGSNCGKGTQMCSCGDPRSCIAGGGSNSVFAYNYYIYTCVPTPGSVHATGRYVPASKICARVKPTW